MVAHSDGRMTMPGTVTVITGGTTGIGAATRDLLRERGARVYNLDARRDNCPGDYFISCDVTDHESVSAAIGEVVNREGRIDCLFANAGIHRGLLPAVGGEFLHDRCPGGRRRWIHRRIAA